MRRRTLLSAVLAAGTTTGCLADRSTDTTTTRETTADTPTDTPTDDAADTATDDATDTPTPRPVSTVELYAAYRFTYETDLLGVDSPNRDQFAFVVPPVSTLPVSAFTLELGENRYDPVGFDNRVHSSMPAFPWGERGVYVNSAKSGPLVFDVPTTDTESAVLVSDAGRHPLPDASLAQFAAAPSFTVESITVPATISGRGVSITVTVSNDGGRDGLFLAGTWISGYPKPIDLPVPAGETAQTTVSFRSFVGGEVTVVHADGTREFLIEQATDTDSG